METYQQFRDDLLALARDTGDLLQTAENTPTFSHQLISDWQTTARRIHRQLDEEVLRVAVVGSIKSGKSTFVNALLGDDITKRGAGVVTSIVTRIRPGKALGATLFFKSWEAVNADIRHAVAMLPDTDTDNIPEDFDIRDAEHRRSISARLDRLGTDRLLHDGVRNPGVALIRSYLAGYDRVCDMISGTDGARHEFSARQFQEHRSFTGEDALSVYLKDIQLDIPETGLDPHVEIADCQGSDSPNPLHLAMIQDYLVITHLIVYLVSSRTGLREADIRFLSMIRKMGIMDNIVFVINCDLSEHESVDSLKGLLIRTREELESIKPDPDMHTFSCLYNLFKQTRSRLSEKDTHRLAQWGKESALIAFSDDQTAQFHSAFIYHLSQRRYTLLLNNHLARIQVIIDGLAHVARLGWDMLARDAESAAAFQRKIADHFNGVRQLSHVVKNTLNGAGDTIKKRLRNQVDRLFDSKTGIARGVLKFVRSYEISRTQVPAQIGDAGFSTVFHGVFQGFRRALDAHMAESVNPMIIQACKQMESHILEGFQDVSRPVNTMVRDTVADYNQTLSGFNIPLVKETVDAFPPPDIESIKQAADLHLPPAQAVLHYSNQTRTEAMVRFGVYRVVQYIRGFFSRKPKGGGMDPERALRDGVARVKRQTESAVISLFKDYQENLKFQYMFKLTDAVSDHLYQAISDRFQAYGADLEKTVALMGNRKEDKAAAMDQLMAMVSAVQALSDRVQQLRGRIEMADSDDFITAKTQTNHAKEAP